MVDDHGEFSGPVRYEAQRLEETLCAGGCLADINNVSEPEAGIIEVRPPLYRWRPGSGLGIIGMDDVSSCI